MNQKISKMLFRAWPFPFGHVRLMKLLSPPNIDAQYYESKIKGYNVKLKYDPNSYIGRYLYYRGIFEEQIISKINSVVHPGMTFLDIGANIGLHTNVAASLVGDNGRVIAIEPQSTVRALLQENISLNQFDNVEIISCALGKEQGEGDIYIVNAHNDGQSTLIPDSSETTCPSEKVKICTVNSVMHDCNIQKVDIVKIDVEGAEMEVLKGGREFFRNSSTKYMFIECVDQHLRRFDSSSEELITWLHSEGYRTYGLIKGCWRPLKPMKNISIDLLAMKT